MGTTSIRAMSDYVGQILRPHEAALKEADWLDVLERWNDLLLLMDQCLVQLLDPAPLSRRPFVVRDLEGINRIEESVSAFMVWAYKSELFSSEELGWLDQGFDAINGYRQLVSELLASAGGDCR